MNSDLLKSVIKLHRDTQAKLSEALGISISNLNDKINGKKASFRQSEIMAIKERYNLMAEEVDRIFFDEKLS